ncbi:MAG: alpha/beta fold hydrolase [Acidimicrobiales bacterium]|nr:alpha/beta fold hydrolase [Acidimicrobiales bacterium]MCB9371450.1 alpha/beta fold hydrolase [Microthrixaceae bacterium]
MAPSESPPVLLLHGFAASFERTWRDNGWCDLLADLGREVVGIDLLGHGTSDKPHDPGAYGDLERRVAETLPPGPVDAIAFSLGARVLLGVAAEDPARFRRIVVAGVGANLFRADDPEPIARALLDGAGEDDRVGQHFALLAAAPGNDPRALAACLRRPTAPLGEEQLARIDRPVLVVLGDRDFAGPADPLLAALPDARLATLRGVDHFATPKALGFLDAALDFLSA